MKLDLIYRPKRKDLQSQQTAALKANVSRETLSDETVAKIASEVTEKAKEAVLPAKPKTRSQDLKALEARLKPLLTKSEAKELKKLFARLDKQREANKRAQAAWRDRQKAK